MTFALFLCFCWVFLIGIFAGAGTQVNHATKNLWEPGIAIFASFLIILTLLRIGYEIGLRGGF